MAVTWHTRARQWLDRFAKALPFPVSRRWTWSSWQSPTWTDYTFDRLAHEGHRLNAAVNICVEKLALAYQTAPMLVTNMDGKAQPDSPLARLIARPNPLMSWHTLAIFIQTYKGIGGTCRLYKVYDDNGRIIELWPYHIGQIGAVPGEQEWIKEYKFVGEGQNVSIPADQIIDLRWPSVDLQHVWEALPPLIGIAREVDTDTEATRYLYALLFNDAVPLTVITTKAKLKESEFNRLRMQFEQRHGGANRGRIAVLEQDATIERMGLNLEEMAFEALRRVPESRISAKFGVPAMYSGLTTGLTQSTYNNVSEARRAFFEDTIVPQAQLDDGELRNHLEDAFPGYTVQRDWSQVVALRESQDALVTRTHKTWSSGLSYRNEGRAALGLPPVESIPLPPGVDPYPPGFGYAFYESQPTIPPELLPEPPKAIPVQLAAKALQMKATTTTERRMARAVRDYLTAEYQRAAEAIDDTTD